MAELIQFSYRKKDSLPSVETVEDLGIYPTYDDWITVAEIPSKRKAEEQKTLLENLHRVSQSWRDQRLYYAFTIFCIVAGVGFCLGITGKRLRVQPL